LYKRVFYKIRLVLIAEVGTLAVNCEIVQFSLLSFSTTIYFILIATLISLLHPSRRASPSDVRHRPPTRPTTHFARKTGPGAMPVGCTPHHHAGRLSGGVLNPHFIRRGSAAVAILTAPQLDQDETRRLAVKEHSSS